MAASVFPERSSATRIGVEPAAFVPEIAPGFRVAALAAGPDGAGAAGAAFSDGDGLPGPVDRAGLGAIPGASAGGRGAPAPGANGDGFEDGEGGATGAPSSAFVPGAPGTLPAARAAASACSRSCF